MTVLLTPDSSDVSIQRINFKGLLTVDTSVCESLNLDWPFHDLLHAVSHPLLYHSILELTTYI